MKPAPENPLIYITYPLPDEWLSTLPAGIRVQAAAITAPGFGPQIEPHLAEINGLLTMLTDKVDTALLDSLPNLKVVSNMAVGVDNIDIAACTARGIPVGHTPGVVTAATADMAVALLLASARRIPETSLDAKDGRWGTWTPTGWLGSDLAGATVGIVGLGNIGAAIGTRLKAFGMRIIYASRTPKREAADSIGAVRVGLDELLKKSDYVILAVDLNASTRGLVGAEELRLMKASATLINIARGPVVHTDALTTALREKWIKAAALDVIDPEPLPASHELYSLQNCLITPHIGSATENTRRKMAELAIANLVAGVRAEKVLHCVNNEVYG